MLVLGFGFIIRLGGGCSGSGGIIVIGFGVVFGGLLFFVYEEGVYIV